MPLLFIIPSLPNEPSKSGSLPPSLPPSHPPSSSLLLLPPPPTSTTHTTALLLSPLHAHTPKTHTTTPPPPPPSIAILAQVHCSLGLGLRARVWNKPDTSFSVRKLALGLDTNMPFNMLSTKFVEGGNPTQSRLCLAWVSSTFLLPFWGPLLPVSERYRCQCMFTSGWGHFVHGVFKVLMVDAMALLFGAMQFRSVPPRLSPLLSFWALPVLPVLAECECCMPK